MRARQSGSAHLVAAAEGALKQTVNTLMDILGSPANQYATCEVLVGFVTFVVV